MSLQNFLMLMKSIPSVDSDPEEKKTDGKSDNEEVTFDNFGSWVNEKRTKNRKK